MKKQPSGSTSLADTSVGHAGGVACDGTTLELGTRRETHMGNLKRSLFFALASCFVVAGCGDDDDDTVDARPPADAAVQEAEISVDPGTNDFGSVTVDETSADATFTVTNDGTGGGTITASLSGSNASQFDIVSNSCTGTLAAGGTCTIGVNFTPTSTGAKTATLNIAASPGNTVTAALDGTGVDPESLAISPSSNPFGNVVVGDNSAVATFTVSNNGGTTTSALTVVMSGTNPTDFVIVTDDCDGNTLAADADCDITARFAPATEGAKTASLTVSSAEGTVSSALSGTGIADADLSITPGLQPFGTVVVGNDSNSEVFTITNTGGVDTGSLTASLEGTNATEFAIISQDCNGAVLGPDDTCNVVVVMQPDTAGSKAATLRVSGTPGGDATATLTGAGLAVGALTISPTSHPFGIITVGATSAAQTFTVQNTGGSATGNIATALAGVDPDQFAIVTSSNQCQGVSLPAGDSCTIAVEFSPNAGGDFSANLTVSATPGNTAQAGLTGTGIPDADIEIAPPSRDFGSLGIGTMSNWQTFTVTNVGGVDTGTLGVTLGGTNSSEFEMNNNCSGTLAPDASCTVDVRFTPDTMGNKVGSLDITASPGGPRSAPLSGAGVLPAQIQFDDDTAGAFPDTLIDETSTNIVWVVRNLGTEVTGPLDVTLTGANPGDFNLGGTCQGATLVNNATCTVIISFEPTVRGDRAAGFTVSGTPGGDLSNTVAGTGYPKIEVTTIYGEGPDFDVNDPDTLLGFDAFVDVPVEPVAPPMRRVMVRNNTGASLTLALASTPTLPGNYYDLDDENCVGPLASHGVCTVWVVYDPQASGAHTLDIGWTATSASPESSDVAHITGNAIDSLMIEPMTVPAGETDPTTDFGSWARGTTSGQLQFRVTNISNAPMTQPVNISSTGAPFQIVNASGCATALDADEFCDVFAIFSPTTNGLQTGTITASGTPLGGTASLDVTGTGIDPATITLDPTSQSFGSVYSEEETTETIVVRNGANSAETGTLAIVVTGTGFSHILPAIAGDCGYVSGSVDLTTLGAGGSCNVRIKYAPTGNGSFGAASGKLTVTATPGTPGTGVAATLSATKLSQISLAPGGHDFGSVDVDTSQTTEFVLTNNSNEDITITSINRIPATADYVIVTSSDPCPTGSALLTSGDHCAIRVRYNPSYLFWGMDLANVPPTADPAAIEVVTAGGFASSTVDGHCNNEPIIEFMPNAGDVPDADAYNFGSALAGQDGGLHTFTVHNMGEQTSGDLAVALSGTNALSFQIMSDTCAGNPLPGNAVCEIEIRHHPINDSASADETATLTVTDTAPHANATHPADTLALSGRRIGSGGVITLDPPVAHFADTTQGQQSAYIEFTLQNLGADPENVTDIIFGHTQGLDDSISFRRITGGTCPAADAFQIANGATCTFHVAFTPQPGDVMMNDYIRIQVQAYPNGDEPYSSLHGLGLTVPMIVNQGTDVDWPAGGTAENDTSQRVWTFKNTGQTDATNVAVSAFTGTGTAPFSKTTTCGATLAAGATCTVTVTFAPTNSGHYDAHFTVTYDEGADLPVDASADAVDAADLTVLPDKTGLDYTEPDPAVPTATRPAFTSDEDGSSEFSVTNDATNATTGPLTITVDHSDEFSLDWDNVSSPTCDEAQFDDGLEAGETCYVGVRYTPVRIGTVTATLTIEATPGDTETRTIQGMATAQLEANTDEQDFGSPLTNDEASGVITFTFTNVSDATIHEPTGILMTEIGGTDAGQFSLVGDHCAGISLGFGESCHVQLRFIPLGAEGDRTATLTVMSTTAGSPATATVDLTGYADVP